jgi:predicted secreted acid phosphatase
MDTLLPLTRKPAVVLDIDGTIVLNCSDGVARVATHIRRLIRTCRRAKIPIFCITARSASDYNEDFTRRQLSSCGLPKPRDLFLMPENDDYATYKRRARDAIRERGYQILLSVGDQFADLCDRDRPELDDATVYAGRLGDNDDFGIKLMSEFVRSS